MRFWVLFLLLLTGCQTALKLPQPDTSADTSHPLTKGTSQRQIAFAGGLFDLERGDLYVAYPYWHWSVPNVETGFYTCNSTLKHRFARSQGYWNEDDNIFGSWPDETGNIIEKALSAQGYNIRETRKSYFEKIAHKPRAELLLSLRVTDIKMNICHIHEPLTFHSLGRSGGEGTVTVTWEVFDTIREQILDSYTTQGYGHVDEPLQNGEKAVFLAAVKDAARNLGASDWFKHLMTTADPVDLLPKSNYKPLTLNTKARPFHGPIRDHFATVRKAVLTVHADLDSTGSGFFISNSGHALTAAKVVGDAQFVQISDTNGTKYRAQVLRTDLRRNVALLKADIQDNFALPVATKDYPDALATVYAIGTPFSASYRA
ncbi:MAG: trypsin-like peptidase domain-containing protein, partial [Elusimicrobiaceae bacterium]|nr:trypsin-like peptidase domain-containing protein [Elusimicrobiaceae bacterium]